MTAPHIHKYGEIIQNIVEKTKRDLLEWKIDPLDELYCKIGDYLVYAKSIRDADGEPFEVIEIVVNDRVIDRFSDGDLRQLDPPLNYDNYYMLMLDLHTIANRKALGSDLFLDDLLFNLKKF